MDYLSSRKGAQMSPELRNLNPSHFPPSLSLSGRGFQASSGLE